MTECPSRASPVTWCAAYYNGSIGPLGRDNKHEPRRNHHKLILVLPHPVQHGYLCAVWLACLSGPSLRRPVTRSPMRAYRIHDSRENSLRNKWALPGRWWLPRYLGLASMERGLIFHIILASTSCSTESCTLTSINQIATAKRQEFRTPAP